MVALGSGEAGAGKVVLNDGGPDGAEAQIGASVGHVVAMSTADVVG